MSGMAAVRRPECLCSVKWGVCPIGGWKTLLIAVSGRNRTATQLSATDATAAPKHCYSGLHRLCLHTNADTQQNQPSRHSCYLSPRKEETFSYSVWARRYIVHMQWETNQIIYYILGHKRWPGAFFVFTKTLLLGWARAMVSWRKKGSIRVSQCLCWRMVISL